MARMQLGCFLLGLVFLIGFALSNSKADDDIQCASNFNRSSFPEGFLFGTASSSYQYEGAANKDGRGPSVWDWYSHEHSDRIADGSNGDVAVDHYHRYKEDVKIMKNMGLDAYRFSMSWSRLLPNGKLSGGINQKGIQFYNDLIDEILRNGLQPYVTLFHWDMPQTLVEEYGGFLSYRVVEDFKNYADLCFKEFGDRVKHWITLNEPHTFAEYGYATGLHAPGRCSAWQNLGCTGGDSGTEPYLVAHNALLAHAHAVKLYRDNYKENQKGVIGITILTFWYVPASEEIEDIDAASRSLDFMFGWYIDPMTTGDYPRSMRFLVGERLPKFTKEESELLTGSYDFLGLNYYTARYASNEWECHEHKSYLTDVHAKHTTELNGVPIGPPAASAWLFVYPRGIYEFILHVKNNYNNPIIYVTENGIDEFTVKGLPLEQALNDTARIEYYSNHLCYIQAAIEAGANVKGYFAWSLLDNYEWHNGYSVRFGIHFIDYEDGLKRYPKWSADWFKKFLTKSTKNAEKMPLSDNNWDITRSVYHM